MVKVLKVLTQTFSLKKKMKSLNQLQWIENDRFSLLSKYSLNLG